MTKGDLIKVLEPFSDEITIKLLTEYGYEREPKLFYSLVNNEAQLIISDSSPDSKAVELKV